jgi:hypothetical protein
MDIRQEIQNNYFKETRTFNFSGGLYDEGD